MKEHEKVCVVLPSNLHWAPYYYRYEKLLAQMGIHFDLIMWNRENISEKCSANLIEYQEPDTSDNHNPFKITKFYRYCRFVRGILRKNRYDKILILGTYAGQLAFLSRWLAKNIPGKYWIDLRDYTYEWFRPYFVAEKKAIAHSCKTALSSYGFRAFLPPHDYITVHNIDPNMNQMRNSFKKSQSKGPIRISFIGNVRYMNENIKLLHALRNDERFILQYYGAGSEKVEEYCAENEITNVDFYGRFTSEQTQALYEKTDIINNLYGNHSVGLTTALSNKFYYGAALHLPILVCPKTCMEEYTTEYGFGFVMDYADPDIGTKLFDWYTAIQAGRIQPEYDTIWNKVLDENRKYDSLFSDWIGDNISGSV